MNLAKLWIRLSGIKKKTEITAGNIIKFCKDACKFWISNDKLDFCQIERNFGLVHIDFMYQMYFIYSPKNGSILKECSKLTSQNKMAYLSDFTWNGYLLDLISSLLTHQKALYESEIFATNFNHGTIQFSSTNTLLPVIIAMFAYSLIPA